MEMISSTSAIAGNINGDPLDLSEKSPESEFFLWLNQAFSTMNLRLLSVEQNQALPQGVPQMDDSSHKSILAELKAQLDGIKEAQNALSKAVEALQTQSQRVKEPPRRTKLSNDVEMSSGSDGESETESDESEYDISTPGGRHNYLAVSIALAFEYIKCLHSRCRVERVLLHVDL